MRCRPILATTAVALGAVALAACSQPDNASQASPTPAPASASATRPTTTHATSLAPTSTSRHRSTPPRSPAPSPTSVRPASVSIAVTGDVLPHPSVLRDAAADAGGRSFDFGPMFAAVAPALRRADIAICQLETTLSATDTHLTTANSFVSPHELATDLVSAGFDGCSFANNHAMDAGLSGVRSTRRVAAGAGLKLAGPSGWADRAGGPAVYEKGGLTVAQLSYSYTVDNRIEHDTTAPPADAPWMRRNLYPARRPPGIIADARRARERGADIVLVSMHWGNMFESMPTAEQQRYARALLTSGRIDAVIGAHPHVIQPCRQIDGRYVLYSVGNFLSAQGPAADLPAASQDGVIATLTFRRDRHGRIHESLRYTPTEVVAPGHRVRPAPKGSASYERTVAAMTALGSACPVSVER